MNKYKIIEFDKVNSEVLVDFEYNGVQLRDRVKVENFTDTKTMQAAIKLSYAKFAKYVEMMPQEDISQDAETLVGVEVEVTKLAEIPTEGGTK